ncbi:hypothetical protein QQ008_17640 [Fulvivirgaceae bacterium BMA10]|uniref:Haem-binding uptake Tiki superfamily ChaN domain-containing protein n=1 Tax=Splendidivirga corallicola TaxID=3051826 RepID=A0ABT8KR29_9BACT|nr:hypothetical protein [Fulvivirgaceae bacterium BMA10]
MRSFLLIIISMMTMFSGCHQKKSNGSTPEKTRMNEVLVLGAIHRKHLTSEKYGTETLKNLIRQINPDVVLTEIPPDRFDAAMNEFLEKDTITESRVSRFPEYVHVLFPLLKEMDFDIIPTAGWTKQMADARRKKLQEISQDSTRQKDWQEYLTASQKSDSVSKAQGQDDDPYWIHTDAYDEAVEIWASTYNRLFNDELGPGGWDNINKSHYSHIEKALNDHQNQGKRILIIYGAGHKGWFLRQLRKRDDINLLEMKPFLDQL